MSLSSFSIANWIVVLFILAGGLISYTSNKLTFPASVTGVLTAVLIYLGAGYPGLVMLGAFFVLGVAATGHKKEYKVSMNLAQIVDTTRTSGQVFANAAVAACCSVLILFFRNLELECQILLASSFASATGDTLSSELGNVYGRRYFNILTCRRDKRGLNGVISLEGTLFGLGGSAAIATIYCLFFGWSIVFIVITLAGLAGNIFDSLLGALFERTGRLTNNAVNFLNTLFASLVAWLFIQLLD